MNNQQIVVMEITDPGHAGSPTAKKRKCPDRG
jgi:hypothetical protein